MLMLKFRDLINPAILNDEDMVGFTGDSEYTDEEGELIMGSWIFVDAMNDGTPVREDDWTLDSKIKESTLYDNIKYYHVVNDNGTLCEIKLNFRHNWKMKFL